MAIKNEQFAALFENHFGGDPASFGLEVVDGEGRKGEHRITLFAPGGRAIEWQHNGVAVAPFKLHGRDSTERAPNGEALRALLV